MLKNNSPMERLSLRWAIFLKEKKSAMARNVLDPRINQSPESVDARTREARRKTRGYYDDPPKTQPEADDFLHFTYAGKYGRISTRRLGQWIETREYLEGIDLDLSEERTFRKDKIVEILNNPARMPRGVGQKYRFSDRGNDRVDMIGRSVSQKRYGEPLQGPVNQPLSLDYCDRFGEVTMHSLRDWYEYEKHVSGWCTECDALKVFTKRQVVEWFGGGQSLLIMQP